MLSFSYCWVTGLEVALLKAEREMRWLKHQLRTCERWRRHDTDDLQEQEAELRQAKEAAAAAQQALQELQAAVHQDENALQEAQQAQHAAVQLHLQAVAECEAHAYTDQRHSDAKTAIFDEVIVTAWVCLKNTACCIRVRGLD